ncbi:histidine kinase [Halomarina halobia]|uniref:Histidine kinase n=1 Tax=Halomarina halobia TaxID=3033386 RepID=A0ABD6AG56_9EURY|nr:histidine kinase [Halomarina sp. PSR21]
MGSEVEVDSQVSTEQETDVQWKAGIGAGLVAGVVMGIMLTVMMGPVIAAAIPALWGLNGLAAGWGVHLVNSAIFGLVFAAIVASPPVRQYTGSLGRTTAVGVAYGVVIWIVAAGIVMPIWLQAVGFPMAPPLPNFNPMSLVGHVVYGAVLGGVYSYATR